MLPSIFFALALGAMGTSAAPASFNFGAAQPGSLETISEYFNMLASKVEASRFMASAPVCDVSKAELPAAPTPLPSPSEGLTLKHVAIGRGTQNYTCDTTNATATPVQIGAKATLFNATCIAATYPDLLNVLPKVALQFNISANEKILGPTNLAISGVHYFENTTTPFFNLDTPQLQLGEAPCAKNNTSNAPADAPKGPDGASAVAWLKLITRVGATGDLEEVYRVETAGGNAPATCAGQPAAFEVQYSAQYWFFEGKPTTTS